MTTRDASADPVWAPERSAVGKDTLRLLLANPRDPLSGMFQQGQYQLELTTLRRWPHRHRAA